MSISKNIVTLLNGESIVHPTVIVGDRDLTWLDLIDGLKIQPTEKERRAWQQDIAAVKKNIPSKIEMILSSSLTPSGRRFRDLFAPLERRQLSKSVFIEQIPFVPYIPSNSGVKNRAENYVTYLRMIHDYMKYVDVFQNIHKENNPLYSWRKKAILTGCLLYRKLVEAGKIKVGDKLVLDDNLSRSDFLALTGRHGNGKEMTTDEQVATINSIVQKYSKSQPTKITMPKRVTPQKPDNKKAEQTTWLSSALHSIKKRWITTHERYTKYRAQGLDVLKKVASALNPSNFINEIKEELEPLSNLFPRRTHFKRSRTENQLTDELKNVDPQLAALIKEKEARMIEIKKHRTAKDWFKSWIGRSEYDLLDKEFDKRYEEYFRQKDAEEQKLIRQKKAEQKLKKFEQIAEKIRRKEELAQKKAALKVEKKRQKEEKAHLKAQKARAKREQAVQTAIAKEYILDQRIKAGSRWAKLQRWVSNIGTPGLVKTPSKEEIQKILAKEEQLDQRIQAGSRWAKFQRWLSNIGTPGLTEFYAQKQPKAKATPSWMEKASQWLQSVRSFVARKGAALITPAQPQRAQKDSVITTKNEPVVAQPVQPQPVAQNVAQPSIQQVQKQHSAEKKELVQKLELILENRAKLLSEERSLEEIPDLSKLGDADRVLATLNPMIDALRVKTVLTDHEMGEIALMSHIVNAYGSENTNLNYLNNLYISDRFQLEVARSVSKKLQSQGINVSFKKRKVKTSSDTRIKIRQWRFDLERKNKAKLVQHQRESQNGTSSINAQTLFTLKNQERKAS